MAQVLAKGLKYCSKLSKLKTQVHLVCQGDDTYEIEGFKDLSRKNLASFPF